MLPCKNFYIMVMATEKIKLTHVDFDLPRFSTRLICISSSKDITSNFEDS